MHFWHLNSLTVLVAAMATTSTTTTADGGGFGVQWGCNNAGRYARKNHLSICVPRRTCFGDDIADIGSQRPERWPSRTRSRPAMLPQQRHYMPRCPGRCPWRARPMPAMPPWRRRRARGPKFAAPFSPHPSQSRQGPLSAAPRRGPGHLGAVF